MHPLLVGKLQWLVVFIWFKKQDLPKVLMVPKKIHIGETLPSFSPFFGKAK